MKTIFRRIVQILMVALVFAPDVAALVEPTSDFYVNDYANVLEETTEAFIQSSSVKLAKATSAQIVVVTVKNLEGRDLESYATELFRSFGIGDKEKNNGVLMLLALEERQSRIEVGYGLEGRLTDGKTGRIQDDYMIPYYKDDNFDQGVLNGYKALYAEVAEEYNYDTEIQGEVVSSDSDDEEFSTYIIAKMFAIFFAMSINRRKTASKVICFVILEFMTIAAMFMAPQAGFSPIVVLIIGTLINFIVSWFFNDMGSGSSYYHGGGHSDAD